MAWPVSEPRLWTPMAEGGSADSSENLLMVPRLLTWLLPALSLGLSPLGGGGHNELERMLTKAGVKTDSESLVAFFHKRTLSPRDAHRLEATVRRLGDDSYDT